ncbi:hypothetical protein [Methyloligella solikamskensis]|uniref:Secreted protein n=1 Tax=Methyloligella solikamskensis TaxID=1177756 RepID=A0ABW3J8Y7_9HYPH
MIIQKPTTIGKTKTIRKTGPWTLALIAAGAMAWTALGSNAAHAAELCAEGDEAAKIACLTETVAAMEEKMAEMSEALEKKAEKRDADVPGQEPDDDLVRFGSAVIIRNQDMRIFPRCLDNPGPDMPNQLAVVMATSCAPAAGQTWLIGRPYVESDHR